MWVKVGLASAKLYDLIKEEEYLSAFNFFTCDIVLNYIYSNLCIRRTIQWQARVVRQKVKKEEPDAKLYLVNFLKWYLL